MKKQRYNIVKPLTRSVTVRLNEDLFHAYEQESIRLQICISELIRERLAKKVNHKKNGNLKSLAER